MLRTLRVLGVLLVALFSAGAGPVIAEIREVPLFEPPNAGERVGGLRALGMLELPHMAVDGHRLTGLSGLAWDDDDGILYAISDKSILFHLRPRFLDGRLAGLDVLRALPLREADGTPLGRGRRDSEGLDILRGRNGKPGDAEIVVSFERFPRITRHRPDGTMVGEYRLPAPLNSPSRYQGRNDMLEAVCVDPGRGPLTAPERPLRGESETSTRIYALDGRSWRYTLAGVHRITAIECLGDGRLLVLEQSFTVLEQSVTLRLARLVGDGSEGSTVSAMTIASLDAARGHLIDNFEGLARHTGTRFFMVSDDNALFLQRQLLLYFELTLPSW